ncbi:MAG: riboflavin synthase [Gemmataceae bacterium]|nr:riboflavin synthase [Gemmataceae bacterium]
MFTGLVEALGRVASLTDDGAGGKRLVVDSDIARDAVLGESVSVNGCCLTVVEWTATSFTFEAGPETLARTNLGRLAPGSRVNLERALRLGDRLGGHLVTGHIDSVGTLAERVTSGEWQTVWFTGPVDLIRQLVPKGSVAVDGVSLTVCEVQPGRFSVMLIPHTLAATTLGLTPVGGAVNLETDLIGKHVAQWLTPYR